MEYRSREDYICECVYQIWEKEGCLDGYYDCYWQQVVEEWGIVEVVYYQGGVVFGDQGVSNGLEELVVRVRDFDGVFLSDEFFLQVELVVVILKMCKSV